VNKQNDIRSSENLTKDADPQYWFAERQPILSPDQ